MSTMTDQRIDMNMLSRVDSDQKATSTRVDSIDDTLRRVEREVSEIRGTLRAAETPSWIRFYVYPACVLISAAMVGAVIHLEIVVNGIGKNVGGLQVSLARQNLTTYAALPTSEFKATLPDVSSSIAVARKHNITVPPKVIEDLSNQLKATEPATSGFWPAAAQLISYRSALGHEDILRLARSMPRCVDTQPQPATTAKAIQADRITLNLCHLIRLITTIAESSWTHQRKTKSSARQHTMLSRIFRWYSIIAS